MTHASCHSADASHTPGSHWVSQDDSEAMSPPTALDAIIDDGFALLRSNPSDKVVLVERGDETFVVKCAKTKETCHHEEAILSHLASTKEVLKLSSGCEILTGPALEIFRSVCVKSLTLGMKWILEPDRWAFFPRSSISVLLGNWVSFQHNDRRPRKAGPAIRLQDPFHALSQGLWSRIHNHF